MSDEKPIQENHSSEEIRQKLEQLVKRACSDAQIKQGLLNDPESLLRVNGVEIPAGTKPRVLVDKDSVSFEFVRETTRDDAELTEGSMSAVVGGKSTVVYMRYTMTNVTLH